MKINIRRSGADFAMEAWNEEGNIVLMDSSREAGGTGKGMRPMQLLLSAIGGCSAIDVITILNKQKQKIESFEIEVEGSREKIKDHAIFKRICLHFKLKGNIDAGKAERAVKLSFEKYCSVSKTLEPTAEITYTVTLN